MLTHQKTFRGGGSSACCAALLCLTVLAVMLVSCAALAMPQSAQAITNADCQLCQNLITSETAWIASLQVSNGALPMTLYSAEPNRTVQVNPYFSDFAALALLEKPALYKAHVRRYLDWHFAHLNSKAQDVNGVSGTIYDYAETCDASGTVISEHAVVQGGKKFYDSTDSYAALFLCVLKRYADTTHDYAYIKAHKSQIDRVTSAMRSTYYRGLTMATPSYKTKYLMDNCEVYRGAKAGAALYKTCFPHDRRIKTLTSMQKTLHDAILKRYYHKGHFYSALTHNNKPYPFRWSRFYMDATAQVYPLTNGVISRYDARGKTVYAHFNRVWSGHPPTHAWEKIAIPDEYYWSELAEAAVYMHDYSRAMSYFKTYARKTSATAHAYPLYNADAAKTVLAARALYQQTRKLSSGIVLDCARRYYTPAQIRAYIRLASKQPGGFVQLHLTDDQNVGIECRYLKQTTKYARKLRDGSYYNRVTKRKFLSRKQVKALVAYAKSKHVALVPEIDTPAHMKGFLLLARHAKGKAFVRKVAANQTAHPGEINIKSKAGRAFARSILSEYAHLFKGCSTFHMGCDEYTAAPSTYKTDYINSTACYLRSKGYSVRMWNDLLLKSNIARIDKHIAVTYWSFDGDVENAQERAQRRAVRASAAELQAAGFNVLNFNSYYLYFIPSRSSCSAEDRKYMVNDARAHWTPRRWDGQSGALLPTTDRVIGSAISVWGEDSKHVSAQKIYNCAAPLYRAMCDRNLK